jgi:glycine betaine/proline transport system ATP-binding protein
MEKISCKNMWKIFGPNPQKIMDQLDANSTREEVQRETGHVIAVKNVSFSIEKGETFVVMGLSGSGKSTLVRCLSRLIEPTAGNFFVGDKNITQMNTKDLNHFRRFSISMVFQHFGLFPHRSVLENIAYGLEIRGMSRVERLDKAMEVLELVGLSGWEHNLPRELSGGMQQRVGLARALAVSPDILMFDEPFSALDPLIRREMQDELLSIQKVVKKTMIFITHDFQEAIKMGDHIAIMKDGEIVQIGTPEEIVANPKNEYVRQFAEDVPRYKVLSAGKLMRQPATQETQQAFAANATFFAHTGDKVEDLLEMIADSDAAIPVCDEKGELLGEIDRSIAIHAMRSKT